MINEGKEEKMCHRNTMSAVVAKFTELGDMSDTLICRLGRYAKIIALSGISVKEIMPGSLCL